MKSMKGSPIGGILDTGLLGSGSERARLLVTLWRRLSEGEPLEASGVEAALAEAAIDPGDADAFLRAVAERDEQDRIVGLLGLSLRAHPHRFSVNGRSFSTWCAIDALFLPAMLATAAEVESRSPVSGRPIRVTVTPHGVRDLDPPEAAVSLPVVHRDEVDSSTAAGIRRTLCRRVHFFADAAEAAAWAGSAGAPRHVEIASVEQAWRHAMDRWSSVLSHAGGGAR